MAKISAGHNYELMSRNYIRTDVPDEGGPYGARAVLRSDGAVLFRVRWTTDHKGERQTSRGGSYTKLGTLRAEKFAEIKDDPAKQIEVLDQLMRRRRFEFEPDTPKVTAPKPEQPVFASLTEKIAWEKAEREKRYAEYEALHKRAVLAGKEAAAACVPTPMVVVQRENPFDDTSRVVKEYEPVMDGVCGFAWVQLAEGNSSFAHWGKKHAGYRSGYKCVQMSVRDYNQSMELKYAFARAYAAVLNEGGIKCWASSRMD